MAVPASTFNDMRPSVRVNHYQTLFGMLVNQNVHFKQRGQNVS